MKDRYAMGYEDFDSVLDRECTDAIVLTRCDNLGPSCGTADLNNSRPNSSSQVTTTPPPLKLMKVLNANLADSPTGNAAKKRTSKNRSEQTRKKRNKQPCSSQNTSAIKCNNTPQPSSIMATGGNSSSGGRSTRNSRKQCLFDNGTPLKPDFFRYIQGSMAEGNKPELKEEIISQDEDDDCSDPFHIIENEAEISEELNQRICLEMKQLDLSEEKLVELDTTLKLNSMLKMISLLDIGFRKDCKLVLRKSLASLLDEDLQPRVEISSSLTVDLPTLHEMADNGAKDMSNVTTYDPSFQSVVTDSLTNSFALEQNNLSDEASESGYDDEESDASDQLLVVSTAEDDHQTVDKVQITAKSDEDLDIIDISSDEDDDYEKEVSQLTPQDEDDPWSHILKDSMITPPRKDVSHGSTQTGSILAIVDLSEEEQTSQVIDISDSDEELGVNAAHITDVLGSYSCAKKLMTDGDRSLDPPLKYSMGNMTEEEFSNFALRRCELKHVSQYWCGFCRSKYHVNDREMKIFLDHMKKAHCSQKPEIHIVKNNKYN